MTTYVVNIVTRIGEICPFVHSSFARERKLVVPGGKTSIAHMHAQHIKSHLQAHGLEAEVWKWRWKWIIWPFCPGLCLQLDYLYSRAFLRFCDLPSRSLAFRNVNASFLPFPFFPSFRKRFIHLTQLKLLT